ncbi:MAG TPA: hypothetical protein PLI18_19390 [Pirellulaceae bacterium]|nr:hypothetical protein [Pirellulaceae bacterium]
MKLERTWDMKLPTAILGIDRLPGGPVIAACFDGVRRVDIDAKAQSLVGTHRSYASGVRHLQDGRFVTAGYDGALVWRSLDQEAPERETPAHRFWSWDLARSPDGLRLASVTGQYLAGSYRYDPAPSAEPCVKVLEAATGRTVAEFEMLPSVHCVAFSPDSRFVAAGNLMGEAGVWEIETGTRVATLSTADFTSWGKIKSHCYIGGIHAIAFSPDGSRLIVAGMGPMDDPMAGNGKQRWQEFDWRAPEGPMTRASKDDQCGEGLIEALAFDAAGTHFLMAGRLRGGNWNAALFDYATGDRVAAASTGYRITEVLWDAELGEWWVAGTQGQPSERDGEGNFPDFGRLERWKVVAD